MKNKRSPDVVNVPEEAARLREQLGLRSEA